MGALELIALISSLAALAEKLTVEKREATEEELAASFGGRNAAGVAAHAALERSRAREASGG